MGHTTEQEEFWAGKFGSEYIQRNNSAQLDASNLVFFSNILQGVGSLGRIMEFGANIGMNIKALRTLLPEALLSAVEINKDAFAELEPLCNGKAFNASLLDFTPEDQYDLVFTKGVLIHINPEKLVDVYRLMHSSSTRYILVAEYYNPVPVAISYRGHSNKLFKRDFAGELMEAYPDLRLVKYGFSYRRDPLFPQDDISWFLLEKTE